VHPCLSLPLRPSGHTAHLKKLDDSLVTPFLIFATVILRTPPDLPFSTDTLSSNSDRGDSSNVTSVKSAADFPNLHDRHRVEDV